jgi:hypothetical protein
MKEPGPEVAELGHQLFHDAERRCQAAGLRTAGDVIDACCAALAHAHAMAFDPARDAPPTPEDLDDIGTAVTLTVGRLLRRHFPAFVTPELNEAIDAMEAEVERVWFREETLQ